MAGFSSRGMSESSAALTALLGPQPEVDDPDGSQRFAAASGPIFGNHVRIVRGNFMPSHPYIFYVAWSAGPLNTPWLFLPAFGMCVTRGNLLHHEQDFSFYQARTRVFVERVRYSPVLILLIPHSLGHPQPFRPSLLDAFEILFRTSLAEMDIPDVEIVTHRIRTWEGRKLKRENWSMAQKAAYHRLEFSCITCTSVLAE